MDDPRVKAQLTDFVLNNYLFGDTTRIPGEDDGLVEEGIIDSTGVLELIEFLEAQFDITVSEEETVPENLATLAKLTRYVTAKRGAARADTSSSAGPAEPRHGLQTRRECGRRRALAGWAAHGPSRGAR